VGEVGDAQARIRSCGNTVWLGGEFDVADVNILDTALRTVTAAASALARIDLSRVKFLRVSVVRSLWAMARGKESLRLELRRRRAMSEVISSRNQLLSGQRVMPVCPSE
jgi:hypothetical protein